MLVSVGETWAMRRRESQALGACPFSAFGEEDGRRLPKRRVEGDESGCTWQVTM
jgi:hypothetical protein